MNRIRELRESKNWTQADLAARLNTKRQTVGHYETGIRSIDATIICDLCDIFGCTADYLLGRSELSVNQLTEEEELLLVAWRRADDRAKSIVDVALEPFCQESTEQKVI